MIRKTLNILFEYSSIRNILGIFILSILVPFFFNSIGFDISNMNSIESISIISGFITSALAIIVTNTSYKEKAEKSIYNNPNYKNMLKYDRTPKKIYKAQKLLLIRCMLIQVILVLLTITTYQLSEGININSGIFLIKIKNILDYICFSSFTTIIITSIIITYQSIKHITEFDIIIDE